ncbi:TetR/AcrR family transcriptional regulator [Amycolatopsis anabasis]|uniref:TetR/AcrR family transcriptional regulator n=1 Tax=Amycolatopsis anabasis TaxID=1840409 RepID=UPI00131D0356|nr:TetR/AcrR family transcriptional regulator [Amycolatopsis anabasis]
MPRTPPDLLQLAGRALARNPGASLSEVATSANVSRSTLYRSFPTREALVRALAQRTIEDLGTAMDKAELETAPPEKALSALVEGMLEVGELLSLMKLLPELLDDPDYVARGEELEDRLSNFFDRAREEGAVRRDLPHRWYGYALGALVSATADGIRHGTLAPRDAFHLVHSTLLSGIGKLP